ncbi:MAG TPA: histidine kinase [Candidatus Limnocylindrales bacterium]|nr:histidine kinase [Candidatus Limnocylindrales bacterium]
MWLALAVWVLDVAFFSTAGANLAEVAPGNLSAVWLIGYAALGAAALIWRKRAPLLVFGIVWLHAMIGTTLVAGYQPLLAVLVAVFTVGALCPRQRAWVIAPAVLPSVVSAVNEALKNAQEREPVPTFLGLLAVFTLLAAGAWALGHWTAVSRRRLAESQRLRKVEAELAVARERERISRELHDIVAHTVTMMVLQAAGAQRILRSDPERAEQSLGQVAELGRTAMNELRRMLVMTQSASASESEPSVGLDDLDELLDRVRGSGVTIGFSQEGAPRRLDASVALAAYRTVQEALTNTAKHAGPQANAQVRLVWTDDLLVEVVDAGPVQLTAQPPASSKELSTGHGLLGLRERVSIAGGRLDAARGDGGGFRVAAVLPVLEG